MDLYVFLDANYTKQFTFMHSIVPMLLEIYKSKKVKNVCVEIWLHPIHPFFSWEFLVGSWEEKKWKLLISTCIILLLIVPLFGWLGRRLRMRILLGHRPDFLFSSIG